jgi:hypothetical protein
MKSIKVSLILPLLTILISLMLNGCYTQLAFVDNENDSTIEPSPTYIYQPEIVPVYIPAPIYDPSPIVTPIPPAGSYPTVTEPSSPPRRDSGYQRSGESRNAQAAIQVSEARTSGSTRGGR